MLNRLTTICFFLITDERYIMYGNPFQNHAENKSMSILTYFCTHL